LIVRESNHKYGGNVAKKTKKQPKVNRNMYKHDYHTTAWDRLLSKTQKTNECLVKGDYARSSKRDFESEASQRIITPSN